MASGRRRVLEERRVERAQRPPRRPRTTLRCGEDLALGLQQLDLAAAQQHRRAAPAQESRAARGRTPRRTPAKAAKRPAYAVDEGVARGSARNLRHASSARPQHHAAGRRRRRRRRRRLDGAGAGAGGPAKSRATSASSCALYEARTGSKARATTVPAASAAAAPGRLHGRAASARTIRHVQRLRAGAASCRASTDRAAAPTRCAASTPACAAPARRPAPRAAAPSNLSRERVSHTQATLRAAAAFSKSARSPDRSPTPREPLDGRAHERLQAVVSKQTARDVRLRR